MFKSAQTELKAVKESINVLYVKNDETQKTALTIQEGILSNTMAIQSNFKLASKHSLLIDQHLDMIVKQEKESSLPPKQPSPPVQSPINKDFKTVLKNQSNSADSSEGAQLKPTMEPISTESSVIQLPNSSLQETSDYVYL